MRGNFEFKTNLNSEIFILSIVGEMIEVFGISEEEAFKRINSFWENNEFTDENEIIYTEHPQFWAKTIYYEQSDWWNYKDSELSVRDM